MPLKTKHTLVEFRVRGKSQKAPPKNSTPFYLENSFPHGNYILFPPSLASLPTSFLI